MLEKIITTMRKNIINISFIRILILAISLLTALARSVYSQEPLPKGAKFNTIIYNRMDMVAQGYTHRGEFVENQNITFLKLPKSVIPSWFQRNKDGMVFFYNQNDNDKLYPISSLDTIVSGFYYLDNGIASIKGVMTNYNYLVESKSKGLFQVSNTEDGYSLTANPKKAVHQKRLSPGLKIEILDATYYETTSREGHKIYETRQSDGTYLLRIEYSEIAHLNYSMHTKTLESHITELKTWQLLNYSFYKTIQPVKLTFWKNDDVFIGTIDSYESDPRPKEGEYRYASGEIFIGEYQNIDIGEFGGRIFVPNKGKTIFADGSVVEGDWLNQYKFTNNEWRNIWDNTNTLTEIRDMAFNLNKEKEPKQIAKHEIAEEEFYAKYPFAKSSPKSELSENGSSAMNDLFPQASKIKVGTTYNELKETFPFELYNKALITIQGKQAIRLTPNNLKIQEFLVDALKLKPEEEVPIILQGLMAVEVALKMKGKTWADALPEIILLNDKVYSVYMAE